MMEWTYIGDGCIDMGDGTETKAEHVGQASVIIEAHNKVVSQSRLDAEAVREMRACLEGLSFDIGGHWSDTKELRARIEAVLAKYPAKPEGE